MPVVFPREPRTGEGVNSVTIIQIIRYLRWLTNALAAIRPSIAGRRRGLESEGALRLTFTAPLGFTPAPDETGTPVFVSWGTVGMLIPSNIADPVGYVHAEGTAYVGMDCTLSATAVGLVSAASLVYTTDITDFTEQTAEFGTGGEPPASFKIMLGSVVVDAHGGITLNNTGSGSIQFGSYLSGFAVVAGGSALSGLFSFHQQLDWRRVL